MKALFNINQRVVCVDSSGEFDDNSPLDLIEGKTYTVARYYQRDIVFGVMMVGCKGAYDQNRFVPIQVDHQLEEQIHEAMKGIRIEN